MSVVTSRLAQTHPRIAAWLAAQPPEERLDAAQRLAHAAAHRAGLTVPLDTDLSTWAEQVDRRGWTQGSDGTWEQPTDHFVRARAAFAVRAADSGARRPHALADSVYESVTALGEEAVRAFLRIHD